MHGAATWCTLDYLAEVSARIACRLRVDTPCDRHALEFDAFDCGENPRAHQVSNRSSFRVCMRAAAHPVMGFTRHAVARSLRARTSNSVKDALPISPTNLFFFTVFKTPGAGRPTSFIPGTASAELSSGTTTERILSYGSVAMGMSTVNWSSCTRPSKTAWCQATRRRMNVSMPAWASKCVTTSHGHVRRTHEVRLFGGTRTELLLNSSGGDDRLAEEQGSRCGGVQAMEHVPEHA